MAWVPAPYYESPFLVPNYLNAFDQTNTKVSRFGVKDSDCKTKINKALHKCWGLWTTVLVTGHSLIRIDKRLFDTQTGNPAYWPTSKGLPIIPFHLKSQWGRLTQCPIQTIWSISLEPTQAWNGITVFHSKEHWGLFSTVHSDTYCAIIRMFNTLGIYSSHAYI